MSDQNPKDLSESQPAAAPGAGRRSAGRPKSEEKRAAILHAASELFLKRGLGASMDAVAQAADVSKQTVYSHFAGKDELFRACIQSKIADYGFGDAGILADIDPATPVGDALFAVTQRFMALIFDPHVVAMHRVISSEASAHPRIAALFFETGPGGTKAAVGALLEQRVAAGELRPLDVNYAAWQLLNMAFGRYHMQLQFGLIKSVPKADLHAHLRHVVQDFLAIYKV
ncbi:MAG: TetR/AcrR family transcriptional regulator [Pseudomonadota bacterium]